MTIFAIECDQGCKPQYLSASHRAEAARKAHYICTGHETQTVEIEVAA